MRSLSFSTSIWLLAFATCVTAQVISLGRCPEVKTLETFDMTKFLGVWHEQSAYQSIGIYALKCINYNFWADKDNVNLELKSIIRLINHDYNFNLTARVINPGQLHISAVKDSNATEPNILVLGTDYSSYAVLYSCTGYTRLFHSTALSILTRERKPKKEPVIEARKILEENKLPGKHLSDNIQSDCGDKLEDKPKDSQ